MRLHVNCKKVNKYYSKLKDLDKDMTQLNKLAVNSKGGCKLTIDFNKSKKEEQSSCNTVRFIIDTDGSLVDNDDKDDDSNEWSKDNRYKAKLIDTESLFVLDSLIKVKQSQRNWIISELNKIGINI